MNNSHCVLLMLASETNCFFEKQFLPLQHQNLMVTIMTAVVKIGDNILISPDLTGQKQWIEGTVIGIESNSFVGQVITAQSATDGDIYFGRDYSFRKESELCLQ